MSVTYCAIIGDIRRSRSLLRRSRVQARFVAAIATINREFKQQIAAKFLLTLGDEFQGLLFSADESYRLVRRFQDLMQPVQFSFGIGIGTLATPLRKEALGMDGDVFYRARAALERAKKSKRSILYDFASPSLDLCNALIGLLEREHQRLTARQRQIIRLVSETDSQTLVARRLRVSQPAISKVVSSLRHVFDAEEALEAFLRTLSGQQQG